MARNLRRSRRGGNTAKKTSAYNVDDIVEIVRGNATVKARLAQLLSDPSSSNPRWLIKFDGLSLKDEEMYEHSFAKESTGSDNSLSDRESSYNRRVGYYPSNTSDNLNNNYSSTNLLSDDSDDPTRKRALAAQREARSRRRQAKIDRERKRRLPVPPPPRIKKRARHSSLSSINQDDDDGEVVKVKLLTGTLYMYRGLHRRAEFVRRV